MATKYVVQTTVDDHVTVSDQTLVDPPSGATLADGDYGDITVSGTGTVMNIDAGVVSTTELGGDITTAGKSLLTAADAAAQRTALGIVQNQEHFNRWGFVSGQYVDQALTALANTTLAGAANRIELYPYIPQVSHSIDRISCYVTTGVASAQVKLVIYASDSNGYPGTLLYESSAIAAATSSAIAEATMSQAFVAGTVYWLGVRHSSTSTLRAIALGAAPAFGTTSTGTAYYTVLRRTLAFATAATSPWAFVNSDRVAGIAPTAIKMRVV